MQGNTMRGAGGNNPRVQGDITAKTGAIINLGTQVINTACSINLRAEEYQGGYRKPKNRSKKKAEVDEIAGFIVKIVDSRREIRDLIEIAEPIPIKDPKLMELLENLKDAAYDAEDLLEEYEIANRRRSEEPENSMTNKVHKVVTSLVSRTPVINLEQMPIKLKELSEKLEAVEAECDTFQLKEKVTEFESEFKKTRVTHSYISKSEVIGRDREKEEIMTFLLSTELDDVSVIAIVGVGGLGKTTLAQSVFTDDAVKNHFYPKMWICVSDNLQPDNFDSRRLGNKILERATDAAHNPSDLVELQRRLQKELGGKRFLLVLDDVWNEKPGKWHGKSGLRDLLFCGGRGSRIVVTTRSRKVASIMSKIQPHILKPLSEVVCWSLFCQIAFGNSTEEVAHSNLAPIGRQIVEKCKGNPLAVKIAGGLLCSKSSQDKSENVSSESIQDKWEYVRDSEIWNLDDENENGILAERSPIKDPKLMELLENLKDAAYDAEDLLEGYEIADRRRSEEAANSMPVRDTMRKNLKEVSERLEAIKAKAHAFKLEEKGTHLQIEFKKQRETHSFVHKSLVFERDEEKEKIKNWLLSNQAGDHENVSFISIVGIGGIGKTTLAKLVFNQESVQDHFKPKMWVCVSDNFDVTRLLKEIIKRAKQEEKKERKEKNIQHGPDDNEPLPSSVEELQCLLREKLSGKRYLLVLDDVWNEDPEKWDRLRDLLLCGGSGSRIVVTTRSAKVASIMSEIQPHNLKPLSEDACWSLFCRRAFGKSTKEATRSKLEPIGRQIVEKCKGNPLAVTTVGGLLLDNISESRWKSVRDSGMWSLPKQTENGILPALRLSYNYLRPNLKQCFAFCAIFPKDYEIEKELVIKLWMAHGFIPTDEGMELEDMGNEIFDELVRRSFFQDVKENEYISLDPFLMLELERTTFQMHDLMHDLAHSVMENEYRVVLNGKVLNCQSKDISPWIRHVSSNELGILAASLPTAQKLRTYIMLEGANFEFPCEVGLFKCLRALDFIRQQDKQEVEKQLFTSLDNLQHLRYLNLSFTSIEMLPESLTSVCFLQTLILIGCTELCELPKEMCKLTNLRCLAINGCEKLTHMPPKMGQLSCLQELSNFIVGRTNEIECSGIGELQGLNLRGHLEIKLKNITNAIDVPQDTLINKPNLTSLDLEWEHSSYEEFGDLEREVLEKQVFQGLQPHQSLKKLGIFGLSFPSWKMDTTFTELVEIKLDLCWRCNRLPPLGELPSLKVLGIFGLHNVECIGDEFYGNEVSGGFPSLMKLQINYMEKLKTWSGLEWKGERAFPSLVELSIEFCRMLTTLEVFPGIKDLNVDQGMMESLKNQKSLESMHQQNCNQSSFADKDQIRSQSLLQDLNIEGCDNVIFSGLGLRYLSSLKTLTIYDSNEFAHVAHELCFLTSLQTLTLHECHGLKSLPEGIGNLTSLRSLDIQNCPEMASLPRELQRLSALKELTIFECHPSLEIRCAEDTGEDWDKIQHIPCIHIGGKSYRKR